MNPDVTSPEYAQMVRRQVLAERADAARRARLHVAAKVRRAKRKRGGRR